MRGRRRKSSVVVSTSVFRVSDFTPFCQMSTAMQKTPFESFHSSAPIRPSHFFFKRREFALGRTYQIISGRGSHPPTSSSAFTQLSSPLTLHISYYTFPLYPRALLCSVVLTSTCESSTIGRVTIAEKEKKILR